METLKRSSHHSETRSAQPIGLVLGGHGPKALTATLSSLAGLRIWCAVRDDEERVTTAGLASCILIQDWSNSTEVLMRLVAAANTDLRVAPTILLARAGTRFTRFGLARALRCIERGADVVLPARTQRSAIRLRIRLRTHQRATLIPPSGTVLSGKAFGALLSIGSLAGGGLRRINDMVKSTATPRVVVMREKPIGRKRNRGLTRKSAPRPVSSIAVIIPAHNEEAWIGHTLRSVFAQTRVPDEIIVVDDGSVDRTGEIAARLGARVIHAGKNCGRRSAAINAGLGHVRSEAVLMLDADTVLEPEAVDHLLQDLAKGYDATGGIIRPINEDSIFARGRALQYALFRFYKPIQRDLQALLVLSGAISCYRTDALRSIGGMKHRTLGEDLDATWELYMAGASIGFTPKAVCYTVEPPAFRFYKNQLRRWAAGIFQAIHVHRLRLRRRPTLLFGVMAVLWDLISGPMVMVSFPTLLLTRHIAPAWIVLIGLLNAITITCGVMELGIKRTLRSLPGYFLLQWIDLYFYSEGIILELILRRKRLTWEMGR